MNNHYHSEVTANLKREREYLAGLEAIAHLGRISRNPHEVRAALRALAQPSEVLKDLAGITRKPQ